MKSCTVLKGKRRWGMHMTFLERKGGMRKAFCVRKEKKRRKKKRREKGCRVICEYPRVSA